MRLLFLVSSLHGGGAERVAATLANAWAQRGDDVLLLACYSGRGRCDQEIDARVQLRWLMDSVEGPAWLRPVAKLTALRRLMREWRPDRVLAFLTNVNVSALIAARGLSLPVVVSERTDPLHGNHGIGPALRLMRRLVYPAAQRVVVQTQRGVTGLRRVAPRATRVAVIPNPLPAGLPAVRAAEPSGDRLILAALGRFDPDKRFDRLIEVFAALAGQLPQWDLWIWGDGPLRAACQERVESLGLTGRIHLPGFSHRPWDELGRAHGFVLNSRVEGFPNALLEAMAMGLACVATDCPSGPAELTRAGADATLVPLDDEGALSAALSRLMQATPRERLAWGRVAAASVRSRYGLPDIVRAWDATWDDFTGVAPEGAAAATCAPDERTEGGERRD